MRLDMLRQLLAVHIIETTQQARLLEQLAETSPDPVFRDALIALARSMMRQSNAMHAVLATEERKPFRLPDRG